MPSQKLVRCELRRQGSTDAGSPRFVPLEIYGLWEFLMRTKHGFDIVEPRASLWLDMEDSPESAYDEGQYERVTEVTAFVYSGRDGMFTRCCRYFPTRELTQLRPIFLSHYQDADSRLQTHVREKQGIWLVREMAGATAAV